jgi:hypothetical protein
MGLCRMAILGNFSNPNIALELNPVEATACALGFE